jgi:hypothetical protein
MKYILSPRPHKTADKGRPDYYITPSRDFTKHTKDCAEKYWNKETAFDWSQNIEENLKQYLDNLPAADFAKIAFMALPVIEETLDRKMAQIRQEHLPLEEDALKSIRECLPSDRKAIEQAFVMVTPLKHLKSSNRDLKDQVEILQNELVDLRAQQRLGFFKNGIAVRQLETNAERQEQAREIQRLTSEISSLQEKDRRLKAQSESREKDLKTKIRGELHSIEKQVLLDLEATTDFVQLTLKHRHLPGEPEKLSQLKELILKRQLRGLKDIANHALVVEQSAIAPLTMGIIHYKRYREIQEAMTTFINDEAKHSATFRRFLAENLEAKEFISDKLIKGADRYMKIARFLPGAGLFLAVIVEAIGAAVLEFFGKEQYMPDRLFRSICKIISDQDERRHLDLCVDMYNELFRKGRRWEAFRNQITLKVIMKSVYGDKSEDHHLIQAFRVFGVEANVLYNHIACRLSEQLARISMYVEPEKILVYMGRK